jgi:hypothetical protein
MSDPRFKTRDELSSWARNLAAQAGGDLAAQLAAVETIQRVTRKHWKLIWDDEA